MVWRWIFFLLAILLGAAIGVTYAWMINPTEYTDTSPEMLGLDYRTDYVLMTAESFREEQNLEEAVRSLAFLGDTPPDEMVRQAINFGEELGYQPGDLALLGELLTQLEADRDTPP